MLIEKLGGAREVVPAFGHTARNRGITGWRLVGGQGFQGSGNLGQPFFAQTLAETQTCLYALGFGGELFCQLIKESSRLGQFARFLERHAVLELQGRNPGGALEIAAQGRLVLLAALSQDIRRVAGLVQVAKVERKLEQSHWRHGRIFQGMAGKALKFVDCALFVPGQGHAPGTLKDSLRLKRMLGKALHEAFKGLASVGQRLGAIGRLRQQPGQPLVAMTELEECIGGLRVVWLGAEKAGEQ